MYKPRIFGMRHLALLAISFAGCTYDEGIIIGDMSGTLIVPRAAATRTFTYEDGTSQEITDPRLIGPVYFGLFPAVVEGLDDYASPARGPVYKPGIPGDTYPYGGGSLGDIRFACMEFLTCKVVSGRYVNFDEMVDWFNNTLKTPITDAEGQVVTSGDYIAETCFDLLRYVSEEEIRLTATEDKNEDGAFDKSDLDFVENGAGDFEATFTLYQQQYYQNEEDGTGFTLWGWMDAPSLSQNLFSTCDPNSGYQESEYNRDFYGGRPFRDLLNTPSNYISDGDWVSNTGFTYSSPDDAAVITFDFQVGQ